MESEVIMKFLQTATLHLTHSVTQTFLQTVVGHSLYSGQLTQTLRVRAGAQEQ